MESYQIDQTLRLKKLAKTLNVNQTVFARNLGMAQSNINRILSGKSQVSVELLNRISKTYSQVNLHWLLTGRGAMFLEETPETASNVKEPDTPLYAKEQGIAEDLAERVDRLEALMKRLEADMRKL